MPSSRIKPNIRKGMRGLIDSIAVGSERGKYGVAKSDAWCLHDYLANVMINGIEFLKEANHGWPVCDEYKTMEEWNAALTDITLRLRQASTTFEQHAKIHDEIIWSPEDSPPAGLEELEDWFNRPSTPEQEEYARRCREVDDLAQENIEFVMQWLSKWWFALWD